jgi:hypothetical protein
MTWPPVFRTMKYGPTGLRLGLILRLSELACCLRMEISFSIVLQRKTLMKNEVNEDGSVTVSPLI